MIRRATEGAGFTIRRPFPGGFALAAADPFLLLDHLGPQTNAPEEATGAPWHPHRGFETVSYLLDGEIAHHDSNGGGGVIREGDTAGEIAGFAGPGVTYTPITYAHVTLAPGAELAVPWSPAFNAMAYVLTGRGSVGAERRPVEDGQLAVFGPGDHLVVAAGDGQTEPLDVLLLGGLPIRAPIAHYGPFVMNTRAEILQAIEDYQPAGSASSPPTSRPRAASPDRRARNSP